MIKRNIILIVDTLTGGGAERVASVLANGFAAKGHSVSILSKSHIEPFYPIDPAVELIYPKTKMNYGTGLNRLLEWVKVHRDILCALRERQPDWVIPFSTTTNGSVIIICKLLRIPVIACEHNNYKVKLDSFAVRFIKRRIYPLSDWLTVLTQRDRVDYYGKFMDQVSVMPNPLPLIPADSPNATGRDTTILAVGNVSRWNHKGFDNLLRIYKKVVAKNPEWRLKIAGGGDPEYLQTLIDRLQLGGQVELLGAVKDIQSVMSHSSVFVLTSRYEGLPMVLIEAMSQGMACVAFDCFTGPGDIMTNKVDGLLIEDQNYELFADRLEALLHDEKHRLALGQQAIETSKRYLSPEITARWESLFETVFSAS